MEHSQRVAIAKMQVLFVRMERVHVCVVYLERKGLLFLYGDGSKKNKS